MGDEGFGRVEPEGTAGQDTILVLVDSTSALDRPSRDRGFDLRSVSAEHAVGRTESKGRAGREIRHNGVAERLQPMRVIGRQHDGSLH